MGAFLGCTRKLCVEKNINEINVDIKENIEKLNTINTNKNMQTNHLLKMEMEIIQILTILKEM